MSSGPKTKNGRVLWVGPSNLGPYHLARYNSLSHTGWDVHVLACSTNEYFRPWQFSKGSAHFDIHQFPSYSGLLNLKAAASEMIEKIRPSVAVFIGYGSHIINALALECRIRGIPRVLNIIGNPSKYTTRGRRLLLKKQVKRVICKTLFPSAVVPGSRGRQLGLELGISPSRIWEVGNVVDVEHFWREDLAPCKAPYFIYVGRLSKEKNLSRLILAYGQYRKNGGTWGLQIVGDGPEKGVLHSLGQGIVGLSFSGWVDYEELPTRMQGGSAFILPSTDETWGLVLNEAMAAGLPLIVSRNCGGFPELCRGGTNGLGFDPLSTRDMSFSMTRMALLSPEQRSRMAKAGQKIISSYTWEEWTTGIDTALTYEIDYQRRTSPSSL